MGSSGTKALNYLHLELWNGHAILQKSQCHVLFLLLKSCRGDLNSDPKTIAYNPLVLAAFCIVVRCSIYKIGLKHPAQWAGKGRWLSQLSQTWVQIPGTYINEPGMERRRGGAEEEPAACLHVGLMNWQALGLVEDPISKVNMESDWRLYQTLLFGLHLHTYTQEHIT